MLLLTDASGGGGGGGGGASEAGISAPDAADELLAFDAADADALLAHDQVLAQARAKRRAAGGGAGPPTATTAGGGLALAPPQLARLVDASARARLAARAYALRVAAALRADGGGGDDGESGASAASLFEPPAPLARLLATHDGAAMFCCRELAAVAGVEGLGAALVHSRGRGAPPSLLPLRAPCLRDMDVEVRNDGSLPHKESCPFTLRVTVARGVWTPRRSASSCAAMAAAAARAATAPSASLASRSSAEEWRWGAAVTSAHMLRLRLSHDMR